MKRQRTRARLHHAFLACLLPASAAAHVINDPPHSHTGSPGVTWPGRVDPARQHQHRTRHNPAKGVAWHGAIPPYEAYGSWMNDRTFHSVVEGHASFAHGHQDQAARYRVLPAEPGGDITEPEADRWNDEELAGNGAVARTEQAFAAWMAIGNASGDRNWPRSDNDHVPGTGVPWHSSVNWVRVSEGPVEVTIRYGEAGGRVGCQQGNALGCWDLPARTVWIDDDVEWYYGDSNDKKVAGNQYDFLTTMLHEIGHVLGLLHFGARANGAVMSEDGQSVRSGATGILHTIDDSAIHGIQDLYAICLPAHSGGPGGRDAVTGADESQCGACGCADALAAPSPALLLGVGLAMAALVRRQRFS